MESRALAMNSLAGETEELQFMRFAFENTAESIFWADRNKRLIYVNNATCNHLGYTRDELLGMSLQDISVEQEPKRLEKRWKSLRCTHHVQFESLHRHKSGDLIPVEV